jgi:hypothetical protein
MKVLVKKIAQNVRSASRFFLKNHKFYRGNKYPNNLGYMFT